MACNGGGRAVDKHGAGITAEAFNHEVSGERVDVGKAGNIGGDVVRDGDAPRVIGAFEFLPCTGRADGQYATAKEGTGHFRSDALHYPNALEARDQREFGAGGVGTGHRDRVGRVERAGQHAHNNLAALWSVRFGDVLDRDVMDRAWLSG